MYVPFSTSFYYLARPVLSCPVPCLDRSISRTAPSIRFDSISLTCSPTFLFLTISHLPLPYVHFVHFHSLTHYSTKQKEDTHEFVSFHLISVQLVAGTYTFVRCFFEVHEQSWDCNGNVLIMPPLPPSSYCVPHSLFLTCFHFHLPTYLPRITYASYPLSQTSQP
jgi:hypothetical protein